MSTNSSKSDDTPSWVTTLEQFFGPPSQAAFGTAIFYQPGPSGSGLSLEEYGLSKYQFFCGDAWTRFGEENWRATWKQVYVRPAGVTSGIVLELKSLADGEARLSASLLLDGREDSAAAQAALTGACDRGDVADLRIYKIGDGQAMSGILLAATYGDGSQLALVLLMD